MNRQEKQAHYEAICKRYKKSSRQEKVIFWMNSKRYADTNVNMRHVSLAKRLKQWQSNSDSVIQPGRVDKPASSIAG